MLRVGSVLDAFCGLGGTRKGINSVAHVDRYVGVDNVKEICEYQREEFGPTIVQSDAYNYIIAHHDEFEFVWASPPCKTHTMSTFFAKARGEERPKPDMRLWSLIKFFMKERGTRPWVVENVRPWYVPPIQWNARVGRHCFWSNYPIRSIKKVAGPHLHKVGENELANWHGLKRLDIGERYASRALIRNIVYYKVAAHVFKSAFVPRGRRRF